MTDTTVSVPSEQGTSHLPQKGATVFRYRKPENHSSKQVVVLARTDRLFAGVQVLAEGGENNLHKHPSTDGCWMVLNGRVRFYGEHDVILAELSKYEGILIPRGTLYWFESASDDVLELLQLDAFDRSMPNLETVIRDRVNQKPEMGKLGKVRMHDARDLSGQDLG